MNSTRWISIIDNKHVDTPRNEPKRNAFFTVNTLSLVSALRTYIAFLGLSLLKLVM